MAKKIQNDSNLRDRKRDRSGWKAARSAARKGKDKRRAYESGAKR